jgi:hypothetical protein
MDISAVSSASMPVSQSNDAQGPAGAMVMRKILDTEAIQGAMLVKMMDQAAGVGRNLDVKA